MIRLRFFILLTLAAFTGLSCAAIPDGQSAAAEFDKIVDEYFAWWWSVSPINATAAGLRDFDALLDETGPEAVERKIASYHGFKERVEAIDPAILDRARRLDRELFLATLKTRLFELEELALHTNTPHQYMRDLGSGLSALLDDGGKLIPARVSDLADRLGGIPAYLDGARDSLLTPPRLYTRVALERCRGVEKLVESIMEKAASPPDSPEDLIRNGQQAQEALSDFHEYLERELLPLSTGDFRLGIKRYEEALQTVHQTHRTPAELLAVAGVEFNNVLNEMFHIASQLYPQCFPDDPKAPQMAVAFDRKLEIIRKVVDAVSRDHPSPEEYPRVIRESLEEIRGFIEKNDLLDLPEPGGLKVEPMPEYAQGFSIAYFQPAPAYEPTGIAYYRYSPVPKDWPEERRESFMREYNNHLIRIFAVHEAIPGHYIQSHYADRLPSPVRRFLGNGAYIEGWAVYCEHMMLEEGFGAGDLRLKLMQLKWYLRTVANAILDIRMHTERISDDEVIRFLTEEAFQEAEEARAKLQRAKLSRVQLTMYFFGYLQMQELRRAVREKEGDDFSLKEFHHAVLNYGPLPVDLIRADMLE